MTVPGDGWPGHEPVDREAAAKKMRERALRLLTLSDRTRYELARRLEKDGPGEVVEEVLNWLEGLGYLDDERFARQWIEARKDRYGPLRLEAELRRKGLRGDWVRSLIDERIGDEGDMEEAALTLIQGRLSPLDRETDGEGADPRLVRRLLGFLQRRGFPPGVAYRAVQRGLGPFR